MNKEKIKKMNKREKIDKLIVNIESLLDKGLAERECLMLIYGDKEGNRLSIIGNNITIAAHLVAVMLDDADIYDMIKAAVTIYENPEPERDREKETTIN